MWIGQLPRASAVVADSVSHQGWGACSDINVVSVPQIADSPQLSRTGKYVFTTLPSDPLELLIHRDRTVESKY
jgi:hypothetical protein